MPGVPIASPKHEDRRLLGPRVDRNDSLRSERSDRRVSFNNDVGVKHIPRGEKPQIPGGLPVKPIGKSDEWSHCNPVQLQKQTLPRHELKQQAEDLVRIIDNVDCVISNKSGNTNSLDRKKGKNKSSTSDKTNFKLINNNLKKNNLVASREQSPLGNNNNGTTNLLRKNKENLNLYQTRNSKNDKNQKQSNKQTLYSPYEKNSKTYKSVPNISITSDYKSVPSISAAILNKSIDSHKYPSPLVNNVKASENFVSVDNLNKKKEDNRFNLRNYNEKFRNQYKSDKNINDITDSPKSHSYKSQEKIKNSSQNLKMHDTNGSSYRPKVGNLGKNFNSENEEPKIRTHHIFLEDSSSPYKEPNSIFGHNNNKPFSYTSAPLSSVEEIRRLSPSRNILPTKEDSYAQVNRHDRHTRSTSREHDRSPRNTDSDYSAKIIISGNNARYNEDEHAYETFQVGGNYFSKPSKDFSTSANSSYDDYKSYNNINSMSSIGVQTDKLPKSLHKSRKTYKSPVRNENFNDHTYKEDLTSASLVRRINHGFGRIDRSPSPPPVARVSSHRLPNNVVPLLSDTDDSEFDFHRRVDPLAKIKKQVMITGKLQEEKDLEEQEERSYERRHKSVLNLNSSEMQPLTVDDVEGLTLEVDKKGKNSLVVARDQRTTKTFNSKSDSNDKFSSSRMQSVPPRGKNEVTENNHKNIRDRSLSPRIFSTLERIKKSLDKDKSTLPKDKKKKKIKIKFFYDPRPQDKTNDDPLDKYTEYKGSKYDTSEGVRENGTSSHSYTDTKNNRHKYSSTTREGRSGKETRYRVDSSESPPRKEISPSRPPRSFSRNASPDKTLNHKSYSRNRDSSSERVLRKENDHGTRNNHFSRTDYDSTLERRKTKERQNDKDKTDSVGKIDYEKRRQYNGVKIDSMQTQTQNIKHYDQRRDRFRLADKANDQNDSDHHQHDSSDQAPSLSEKYKSLTRRASPHDRMPSRPNKEISVSRSDLDEDDQKEKMQRQRNKFFGALLGDGKGKSTSPVPKSSAKESQFVSSTLPRTMPAQADTKQSSFTLQRASRNEPSDGEAEAREATLKGFEGGRTFISRDREADHREHQQWEKAKASTRPLLQGRRPSTKGPAPAPPRITNAVSAKEKRIWKDAKYSAESSPSPSSAANTPTGATRSGRAGRVGTRTTSFQPRYFGDTDTEVSRQNGQPSPAALSGDYRSLPTRRTHSTGSHLMTRRGVGVRRTSPGARGSAGSSLQSSESEADSHGGSHASRASHVSTGSNRSVYLHATAIADIPVRRSSDEAPSERGVSKQTRKVKRSFSLVSPWKPRNYRDKYEIDYDNRDVREVRHATPDERPPSRIVTSERKSALPPRPPRKVPDPVEIASPYDRDSQKKVGRSMTISKDSKLAGWLKRRRNKEAKGI